MSFFPNCPICGEQMGIWWQAGVFQCNNKKCKDYLSKWYKDIFSKRILKLEE